MDTLFISDLHLSPERPNQIELFRRLLQGPARKAQALYILGDLFEEFWAGNDDHTPPNSEILAELKTFTGAGGQCFILRGNRDLMLDTGFEPLTGCVLLPDETVIETDGVKTLLMHGDTLCTRDWSYQIFRAFMDCRPVRTLYLGLPYDRRIGLAHGLRPAMRRSTDFKALEIVDVTPAAVERAARRFGVSEIIHGHTHRPAVHAFEVDGRRVRRFVLGDWYVDPKMLVRTGERRRLVRVEEYLEKS